MNTYTRFLREEEAHFIYKKHLKHHFPADEVKPWKSIARMWADGCYFAVGVFEDRGDAPADTSDDLRGYAFFVESPDCGACLLDYYAILPEYRDAGLGGHTLQRLSELVRGKGKYILLETEDIDFAKTEEQIAARMEKTLSEIELLPEYDYFLINDDLDEAIETARSIMKAEHCKTAGTSQALIDKYKEER